MSTAQLHQAAKRVLARKQRVNDSSGMGDDNSDQAASSPSLVTPQLEDST
jgi:hypothetical protein